MEPKPVRDDAGAQQTIKDAAERRVPDDLLGQLKAADDRLHAARQRLEATLADAEYGQGERAERVGEELRAAEREVEEITKRIAGELPPGGRGG